MKRKFSIPRKQVTTYILEFQRKKTFQALHQGANSQRFC